MKSFKQVLEKICFEIYFQKQKFNFHENYFENIFHYLNNLAWSEEPLVYTTNSKMVVEAK